MRCTRGRLCPRPPRGWPAHGSNLDAPSTAESQTRPTETRGTPSGTRLRERGQAPLSLSTLHLEHLCGAVPRVTGHFCRTPGLHPWDTSHTTLQTALIRHGPTSMGPKSPAGMPGVTQGWYSPAWLVHARPAGTPPQPPQTAPQHTCRSRCHPGTRLGRLRRRASFPHALTVTADSVLPFAERQDGPRWQASRGGDTVSGRCNAFTKHLLVVCGRPLLSGFMLCVPSHKRAGISVVTRQKLLNGEPRAFW